MDYQEYHNWLLKNLAPDGDYTVAIAREYAKLDHPPEQRVFGHKHTLSSLFLLLDHTQTTIEAAKLDRERLKKLCRAEIKHHVSRIVLGRKDGNDLQRGLRVQFLLCSGMLRPDLPFPVDEMAEIEGLFSLEQAKKEAAILLDRRAQRQRSAA